MTNILHNAIRFQRSTPGHVPKLEIALKQNDKDFTITISDNGEGIPPDVMPKIFDMFYRGNIKSTGSGLGLYNAKLAIRKMHGILDIFSVYGQGTTCIIKIPDLSG